MSVSRSVWSRLKYLNNYLLKVHEILKYWMDYHPWISTDIHAAQKMKKDEIFGDPLTFLQAPRAGQIFPNTLVYDQIPAKLMTFPSASAVLHLSC